MTASLSCTEIAETTSEVLLVDHPENLQRVKLFAQAAFARQYNAQVRDFLPYQLALIDGAMQIRASMGYQPAKDHHLYLEHYLDLPVEQMIARELGIAAPARQRILEMGNLASQSPGSTRRLILNLSCYFLQQGFRWLVITATPRVKNSFDKLGGKVVLHRLAEATPAAVSAGQSDWGSYYEQQPKVYAIDMWTAMTEMMADPVMSRLLQRIVPPRSDMMTRIGLQESA
ncbi:thermostable hemolysin [Neptuniibacter sp. CAU 1671]|uniref:thermostable hemolysin n=1 Tax=Neptuniibacter sp. CAU 1671 TaxID=3032593 RepID=UPI0023DC9D57|nr:thermostable hemolysin [Neptuniibacter sp. CAU 1671]MDF2181038.1 thermostable hemolysin [Neptuniibacter sp. CAU 1671]